MTTHRPDRPRTAHNGALPQYSGATPRARVDQTTFGVPGGNCFSACVATLLGIPIEEVPYFMGMTEAEGAQWWERFLAWLEPRGFFAFDVPVAEHGWRPPGNAWAIMSGPCSRGPHCVVSQGAVMWHDPHPSREGIEKVDAFTFLVPFLPSAPRCGARIEPEHADEPCQLPSGHEEPHEHTSAAATFRWFGKSDGTWFGTSIHAAPKADGDAP